VPFRAPSFIALRPERTREWSMAYAVRSRPRPSHPHYRLVERSPWSVCGSSVIMSVGAIAVTLVIINWAPPSSFASVWMAPSCDGCPAALRRDTMSTNRPSRPLRGRRHDIISILHSLQRRRRASLPGWFGHAGRQRATSSGCRCELQSRRSFSFSPVFACERRAIAPPRGDWRQKPPLPPASPEIAAPDPHADHRDCRQPRATPRAAVARRILAPP